MTQHNKSDAVRTVEAWCCGIAADDELGDTNVTVYESKESCEKANQCAVNDPKWCAPRKLSITFDTNWVPADQLHAPVADAGVKRPTVTRKMLLNQPKYPAGRAEAYWTSLENKVSSLELQLKTVLDRESATAARYDAKLDALELQLTQAHGKNGELAERVKELEDTIRWALGENGEFRARLSFEATYYWRNELRARAALSSAASEKDGE